MGGTPGLGDLAADAGPTQPSRRASLNQSLLFSVSQFPPWDQVRRARTAGNPVDPRHIWNTPEGLGGQASRASAFHKPRKCRPISSNEIYRGVRLPRLLPGGGARVGKSAQCWALGLDFQCGSVVSQNSVSQKLDHDHLPGPPSHLLFLHTSDPEGL